MVMSPSSFKPGDENYLGPILFNPGTPRLDARPQRPHFLAAQGGLVVRAMGSFFNSRHTSVQSLVLSTIWSDSTLEVSLGLFLYYFILPP